MSFMEHPLPDACRARMPEPDPHPPGPPSRPMVCHMPKGHDGQHAITRRPRTLDRRWDGDARVRMTAAPTGPDPRTDAAVGPEITYERQQIAQGLCPRSNQPIMPNGILRPACSFCDCGEGEP